MDQIAAAKEKHQAGDLYSAEQDYLAILNSDPSLVEVWHALGVLAAEKQDYVTAKKYFLEAHRLAPANPQLLLHVGNAARSLQDYAEAESIFLRLTRQSPDFAAGFNNLGTVYFSQQKWRDAEEAFHKAIEVQADYVDAYYNLGLVQYKAGHQAAAKITFEALLALAPGHVAGKFQLACLNMGAQQYHVALLLFSSITEDYPHHLESLCNAGSCCIELDRLKLAEEYYNRAYQLAQFDEQILFNLGVINMRQGRLERATDFYRQTLDIDAHHVGAHNNLGVCYLAKRQADLAEKHFKEVLRLQPDNAAVAHTLRILSRQSTISASPPAYIESLFDSYASYYDAHLLNTLAYSVPQAMSDLLSRHTALPEKKWRVLDLGCGTGLCASYFASVADKLAGVDLSERMLTMARNKSHYDELIHADIVSYLDRCDAEFDLVLAADVLVYFGELEKVMFAVKRAMKQGAYFLFSAEIGHEKAYELTDSGRFVHMKSYIDRVAMQAGLVLVGYEVMSLRTHEQKGIPGHLYLLQKPTFVS